MAINKTKVRPLYSAVDEVARNSVATHEARTDNPHEVTALDTGAIPSLDSRLVSAMDFRGEHPRFFGVKPQTSGQYSEGSGTTFSDGNGMQGVIEQGKNMYIGEGYENVDFDQLNQISEVDNGDGTTTYTRTASGSSSFRRKDFVTTKDNNFLSCEVVEMQGNWVIGSTSYGYGISITSLGYNEFHKENNRYIGFYNDESGAAGDYIRVRELQVSETVPVPFVPNTAPNGRLVIEQPWTSLTHSFIYVGQEVIDDTFYPHYLTNINGTPIGGAERTTIGGKVGYVLDSFTVGATVYSYNNETGVHEGAATLSDAGISPYGLIGIGTGTDPRTSNSIQGAFIYEGNLTEQELLDELAKIKSENFVLPDDGFDDKIPYTLVQRDDSGSAALTSELAVISGRIGSIDTTGLVAPFKVPFDEFWSVDGVNYDPVTNRFNILKTGTYNINFMPFWQIVTEGNVCRIFLMKNTETGSNSNNFGHAYTGVVGYSHTPLNSTLELVEGDYLVFFVASTGTSRLYNKSTDKFGTFTIQQIK